jgi:peptidoglycan hydrolase CwlO-like protein
LFLLLSSFTTLPALFFPSVAKQSHLEISFEQVDHHLKDAQQEKRRLQEQLTIAQQKIQALEEEATQARAHVDLYRIQLEETALERDATKVRHTNNCACSFVAFI